MREGGLMNRATTIKLISAGSLGAAMAAYAFLVRPWHLSWGATESERNETLPGDDVVPNPMHEAPHAITVNTHSRMYGPGLYRWVRTKADSTATRFLKTW